MVYSKNNVIFFRNLLQAYPETPRHRQRRGEVLGVLGGHRREEVTSLVRAAHLDLSTWCHGGLGEKEGKCGRPRREWGGFSKGERREYSIPPPQVLASHMRTETPGILRQGDRCETRSKDALGLLLGERAAGWIFLECGYETVEITQRNQ